VKNPIQRRRAARRTLASAFTTLTAASAFVATTALPANATPPVDTHGLTIVHAAADVPGSLADAYAAAATVAMGAPDDFGYPSIDGNAVDLPTVSPAAVALQTSPPDVVKATLNGYAKGPAKKAGDPTPDKAPNLGSLLDHVVLTHPAHGKSVARLQEIGNQVFDLGQLPAFADAAVTESGIDASGHIILTVGRLTDNLAAGIVARFGTDDIRIVIDPSSASTLATRG